MEGSGELMRICDLILAVPRNYGRADYLPVIAWGQVASQAACKAGPENRQLLLDRNYTASVRLTWHGKASASGCGNSGETAKAGTYVAELTFQDKTAAAAKESFTLG